MSDNIKDLCKRYEENVAEPRARSVGLFTIPEYPEFEAERGMWSTALDAILTTLRYLAPATLLTLLWGQQSFIYKLLKYIESAFRALLFSSEEQKQAVLQWLSEYGPVRVDDLGTVWRHGWILCGVLDAALPGACAGHPPTSLSLKHAQAIADHYLGVEPVFSRQELDSNENLSKHQEWRLTTYVDCVRQALLKVTPPVTKPQKTLPETTQFTLDYVARGTGLSAAQINNPMYFKIYPTSQQSLDPGELTIVIKGPNDDCGMRVCPPVLGKAQLIRQQLLGVRFHSTYTENTLPLAYGTSYLRNYGKNDMTKTYHIPKTKYNIDIEAESTPDHVKIGYTVNLVGKYEIYITSRGQNIVGSPYTVAASNNLINLLEKENICLEDGEEIDIVDIKSDRKVVVRIVDFVTEKMLLKENGVLEKISEDEAKYLMENDVKMDNLLNLNNQNCNVNMSLTETNRSNKFKQERKYTKFNEVANKVLKINKVCKVFYEIRNDNKILSQKENINHQSRNHQDIPDVVNSTLSEATVSAFMLTNNRDKFIVPENISVSILTEKTELSKADIHDANNDMDISNSQSDMNLAELKILRDVSFEEDDESKKPSHNPFLDDIFQNSEMEKILNTFVTSEYETNKTQNEETQDSSIKIMVNTSDETPALNKRNPFTGLDIFKADRPKSPIFKIISEDDIDSSRKDFKNTIENEFTNPFFTHQHQLSKSLPVADFIIGAPVSLPPEIRSLSQETDIESLVVPNKIMLKDEKCKESIEINKKSEDTFSSSIQTNYNDLENYEVIESCQSLNSKIIHNTDEDNISQKKEMWDSAYVSIDENNAIPDSNNNDNNILKDTQNKQKTLNCYYLSNMGPAEREIWENCTELLDSGSNKHEEIVKINKWDLKKPIFTPIIEENDRNISLGMTGIKSEAATYTETDPVTIAFAEINDLYDDYFPNAKTRSTPHEHDKRNDLEVERISDYGNVKSASVNESDVMRHKNQSEGTISEIQADVTESVSVSQILHVIKNKDKRNVQTNDHIRFGDSKYSNIVLEKKKYWDEKIRQIEANAEESRAQQRKRRLSAKQLRRNDSLSKRKGKQIIKKYFHSNEGIQKQNSATENQHVEVINSDPIASHIQDDKMNIKLVKNWKTFWDNKLESENNDVNIACLTSNSTQIENNSTAFTDIQDETNIDSKLHVNTTQSSMPVKQELPEEIFKAFETSPKRFFGTSRKQILNKIDNFLGKPKAIEEPLIDNNVTSYESGLVSSRISLFHNISQTDKKSWTQRKTQSMHNIHHLKDSEHETNNTPYFGKSILNIETDEKGNTSKNIQEGNFEQISENITVQEKRARMTDKFHTKSFDETGYRRSIEDNLSDQDSYVKRTIKCINKQHPNVNNVPKISSSKSEMDIFNKFTNKSLDEDFDKYKSCDELPKVSVKSFISLYEDVSKSAETKSLRKLYNKSPEGSEKYFKSASSISGTAVTNQSTDKYETFKQSSITQNVTNHNEKDSTNDVQKSTKHKKSGYKGSYDGANRIEDIGVQDFEKESTYISLSDIDLEIVEKCSDRSLESSPEREIENSSIDYKSRFKLAKKYFQSLEELRETKKQQKLNECQLLLNNKSTESLTENNKTKRIKKKIKSHTMPSSEITEFWNQLQERQSETKDNRLIKISEKFNVEDLFSDVMEGRLSRQGSLRGIPHKKAVLEAFKSMENISDNKLSPYELAVSQISDIADESRVINAQTYLSEYPYLPTTDPSKSHSRLDVNASGLISFKDLLRKKVRRNSVPDLRLNPSFTVDL